MSNVIDFLERMGQDAQLRHASRSEMELVLMGAQLDPKLQEAILAKDQQWLESLLGRNNLCCAQFPGKGDEDEEGEESPSKDGDELTMQSTFYVVASVG
jgi:hypothetical protein